MTRRSERSLKGWILPILLYPDWMVVKAVHFCFLGWWLDGLTNRRSDHRFVRELERDMAWVLGRGGGKVIPNGDENVREPRSFDLAVVTVVCPRFQLRFVRVRGEITAYIRPLSQRRGWENVNTMLGPANGRPDSKPLFYLDGRPMFYNFWSDSQLLELDGVLEKNWPRLIAEMAQSEPTTSVTEMVT